MIEKQHQLSLFKSSTPIHQANSPSMDHKPISMIMGSTRKPIKPGFSSIFLFFSLFIIFFSLSHVPPSTLFKDTKFWFILSNAIILVVAADSGAFSSSDKKIKHDLYEEFLINSRAVRSSSSSSSSSSSCSPNSIVYLNSQVQKVSKEVNKSKEDSHHYEEPMQENNALVPLDDPQVAAHEIPNSDIDQEKRIISTTLRLSKKTEKLENRSNDIKLTSSWNRSNSEKAISVVPTSDDQDRRSRSATLHRSKTEKLEKGSEEIESCDEFSAMSIEELNKRVEEFIKKFNREIRLQETKNHLSAENQENEEEEEEEEYI